MPLDSELWVAAKAIFAADLAVKKGGVIIFVTPCTDGISAEHREIMNHRFLPCAQVKKLVEQGKMKNDPVGAAFLAYVGNIIEGKAKCILVSPGIDSKIAQDMGLITAETPQDALGKAFDLSGKKSSVTVIKHGSEVLPLIDTPNAG